MILCSGKIYYDLIAARKKFGDQAKPVSIHRIEQLYPLNVEKDLMPHLAGLAPQAEITWVQEEPFNQGAWPHVCLQFYGNIAAHPLNVVSRPASASPATGSHASHKIEQDLLLQQAFRITAS